MNSLLLSIIDKADHKTDLRDCCKKSKDYFEALSYIAMADSDNPCLDKICRAFIDDLESFVKNSKMASGGAIKDYCSICYTHSEFLYIIFGHLFPNFDKYLQNKPYYEALAIKKWLSIVDQNPIYNNIEDFVFNQ